MKYIWEQEVWPEVTWDHETLLPLLGKARQAQGRLLEKFQNLGFELSPKAQAEILTEEAVQTSAIEGERLDPASVRSSVARKLGLSAEGLPFPPRHVEGLVEVLMDAVALHDMPLSTDRLKGWQAALFPSGRSGFKSVRTGEWRTEAEDPMQVVSGPVGRERIHYEAPPGELVPSEMDAFLNWWEKSRGKMDGLLRAGAVHFKFVTVHPFEDGNGRIARALTDMALAQDENAKIRFYSLSSQIMKERDRYYLVLEKTQKGMQDITPWLVWFLECFLRAVENSMGLLEQVTAKAKFWQAHAGVSLTERQRKVLNRMLDAGKGNFEGGLTTRKYVSLTKTSRATAFREIQDLLDKKMLVPNEAKGRSVSYEAAWE
jgi:Fic family protein